jgi:hypothetical protein
MQNATTLPPQAITARLPAGLKSESEAYAASLGVSLNALIAVALRDYLDARKRPLRPLEAPFQPLAEASSIPVLPSPPLALSSSPGAVDAQPVLTEAKRYRKPPGGSGAPCPCGAKKPPFFDYPLKWRECHGKAG